MNRPLYSLLLHLALPLIGLRLLWRGWRAPGYRRRIAERFAFGLPLMRPGGIWIHAVSLGESIAATPLIRELLQRYPQLPITVTCMTPTGLERISSQFGARVQLCYLPYDLPWACARFLDRVQPRLALIMETELWPNHIHACHLRGIRLMLVNGRLSERSARGYARFSRLTAPMLAELDVLAVQTEAEAERFRQLGAHRQALQVTGSIKFDVQVPASLPQQAAQLRASWGAAQRPLWIAASTHAGEDEQVLAAHRQLLAAHPDALLILVPRHPERFAAVFELCRREGFECRRRSTGEPVDAGVQVLVGDTLGELLFLYALADLAFVGGSLVANGGHNLLEPAALGKPLLSGPHLFNFTEIASLMRNADNLIEVQDAASLAAALQQLLAAPDELQRRGHAGLAVLQANQGALQRVLDTVDRLLR